MSAAVQESAELQTLLVRFRDAGLYTHAYAAAGRLGEHGPRQRAELLPDGRDVFDFASLTKALATTPLVYAAVARGDVTLDQSVGAWLGAERVAALGLAPMLAALTVRSLLRHETGLPAWRNFWVCQLGTESAAALAAPESRRRRLVEGLNRAAGAVLASRQGSGGLPVQVYSDLGFLLLGLCLEETTATRLDELFDGFCSTALALSARSLPLGYGPKLQDPSGRFVARAVPTGVCPIRGRLLAGEVHDENCAAFGGVAGHAGLFGTGEALVCYLEALTSSPVGQELLAANAAARPPAGSAAASDPTQDALCGWRLGNGPSTAPFCQGRAIGHPGFTGVAFWICPETHAYAIFLTNRVVSGRTQSLGHIAAARHAVLTALAEACD